MSSEHTIESGIRFKGPEGEDIETVVNATFLQVADGQLQQVFVGVEPVLVIQPEFHAEEMTVHLNLTGVEINPPGLVEILEALLDAAKTMVEVDEEHLKTLDEREADDVD